MFLSLKRAIWSGVATLIVEFYLFNFVARNINIIASRTLGRQIFDYILNFVIFFAVIYLVVTLIVYIVKWCSPKK